MLASRIVYYRRLYNKLSFTWLKLLKLVFENRCSEFKSKVGYVSVYIRNCYRSAKCQGAWRPGGGGVPRARNIADMPSIHANFTSLANTCVIWAWPLDWSLSIPNRNKKWLPHCLSTPEEEVNWHSGAGQPSNDKRDSSLDYTSFAKQRPSDFSDNSVWSKFAISYPVFWSCWCERFSVFAWGCGMCCPLVQQRHLLTSPVRLT